MFISVNGSDVCYYDTFSGFEYLTKEIRISLNSNYDLYYWKSFNLENLRQSIETKDWYKKWKQYASVYADVSSCREFYDGTEKCFNEIIRKEKI